MLTKLLKILIVDPDAADRQTVVHLLKEADIRCDCVEAASTADALAACATNLFDCAILDYPLPGVNGLDFLDTMRHQSPDVAVVILTANGDEFVAAEAMKRGAADYLPKYNLNAERMKQSLTYGVSRTLLQRKIAAQQRELELFNRVLVHDLKSPLNSIRSFAELIAEGIQSGKNRQVGEYSRRISRAAERLAALIDELHRFTTSDDQVVLERVAAASPLEDALSNLAEAIRTRGVAITADPLPVVLGNAPQLMQLFQNLIGNAIKYASGEKPAVHIGVQPAAGGGWQISVRDNGIGIARENLERIFEPFQRLHRSVEYEGTGLGLATCKKIVERHRGRIWCESELGQGATFFFTLQDPWSAAKPRPNQQSLGEVA